MKKLFLFTRYALDAILFYSVSGYRYGLDRPASLSHCGNVYQERISNCNAKAFRVHFGRSRYIPVPTQNTILL